MAVRGVGGEKKKMTKFFLGLRIPFGLRKSYSTQNVTEWWYDPDINKVIILKMNNILCH